VRRRRHRRRAHRRRHSPPPFSLSTSLDFWPRRPARPTRGLNVSLDDRTAGGGGGLQVLPRTWGIYRVGTGPTSRRHVSRSQESRGDGYAYHTGYYCSAME
jgi:hypothetical protein